MEAAALPFKKNPEDVSELSYSAIKIIRYLEQTHRAKGISRVGVTATRMSSRKTISPEYPRQNVQISNRMEENNINFCFEGQQNYINGLSSLDRPTPCVQMSRDVFPEADHNKHFQDTVIVENATFENDHKRVQSQYFISQDQIPQLNDSVDIFEETAVSEERLLLPNTNYYKQRSLKRKPNNNQMKKITSYFPITKFTKSAEVTDDQETANSLQSFSRTNKKSKEKHRHSALKTEAQVFNFSPGKSMIQTNIGNMFEKYGFSKPPDNVFETVRNLRAPCTKLSEKAYDLSEHSADFNVGNHEVSLLEASAYNIEKQMSFHEKYSQIKQHKETHLQVVEISEENWELIFSNITGENTLEINLTLCYKEKFCLLNKEMRKNYTPNGILLLSKFMDGTSENVYVPCEYLKVHSVRNLLLEVLRSYTRKICFDAQAFIIYILDSIEASDNRVCYEWSLLDPMVGGWLLDPDNPPSSFPDVCKTAEHTITEIERNENWMLHCCHLLHQQSEVMEKMYRKLMTQKLWDVFLYLETQTIPLLAVMESTSILVDTEKLKYISEVINEKINVLEKKAEEIGGHKFSLSSTTQVRAVLYDELKLDKVGKVAIKGTLVKGVKSTSEHMLKLLTEVHPLPKIILEHRHLFKLKSAYSDTLFLYAKEKKSISSVWDLCSAATGRITSSKPNLQAIPKQNLQILSDEGEIEINMRSCFIARKGCALVSADFQHIELRVFGILSQDLTLIKIFQSGGDIFKRITQLRLKKEEITAEERNQTKTLIYALMYGAGIKKLTGILSISEEGAINIKNNILDFNKRILEEARERKVLKSISGRKRIFSNILSTKHDERTYSERQAMNFVIQGSAADICKGAMLRCELEFKRKNLQTKLLLQIHDELLWEVPESDVIYFIDLLKVTLETNREYWARRVKMDIPLPVSVSVGRDWGNMTSTGSPH